MSNTPIKPSDNVEIILEVDKTAFLPFDLGKIIIADNVIPFFGVVFLVKSLRRHLRGDWGPTCPARFNAQNIEASHNWGVILSFYPVDPEDTRGFGLAVQTNLKKNETTLWVEIG